MATLKTGWMKKLINGVSEKIFAISHVKSVYYNYAEKKTLADKLDSMDKEIDTAKKSWRGIRNNLTSTSTTDSLSAYQGKVLNDKKVTKTWTLLYENVKASTKCDISTIPDGAEISITVMVTVNEIKWMFTKKLIKGLNTIPNDSATEYFPVGSYYSTAVNSFCGIVLQNNSIYCDAININGTNDADFLSTAVLYIHYRD